MTWPMVWALLAAAVVVGGAAWAVRRGLTTPRLYSTPRQQKRASRVHARKARDTRNQQLMYQIDQNNKRENKQ